jgi:epoxyqueuosine reductase
VQAQISADRTSWIRERARALGFDLCGVVRVEEYGELVHLPEWLAHGYAGEMNYLRDPRRADPRLVLEGARSLIVAALNYNSAKPYSTDLPSAADDESPRGWISRYAWGDDYHELLREKLDALIAEMRAEISEPFEARAYVDTGPIIERVAAKHAGLGWLAKNTCLINQQLGSWLFLGVIVTTLELEPSLAPASPPPQDLCGSCTRCLDACPTQAFPEPYVLDARRCISYLTIELRGPIPEELRPQMGRAVVGCDICQDVCPWNRKAPVTALAAFQPREVDRNPKIDDRNSKLEMRNSPSIKRSSRISNDELRVSNVDSRVSNDEFHISFFAPELEWLASLSQEQFSAIFRGSAVKRAKWRGLVRNACVALGNSRIAPGSPAYSRVAALLERLAASDDSLISDHARWALARLPSPAPPASLP